MYNMLVPQVRVSELVKSCCFDDNQQEIMAPSQMNSKPIEIIPPLHRNLSICSNQRLWYEGIKVQIEVTHFCNRSTVYRSRNRIGLF